MTRLALFLAARVLTFATNPARDPAPELLAPAIAPAGPKLATPTLAAWSCVDRGGPTCTREQLATVDVNGDFTATPRLVADDGPDAAAEASAYYHAARARAFFERLAGQSLPNAVDVVAGFRDPPRVPRAAAFYLRAGEVPELERTYGTTRGTVWLGRGATRDVAYDGDVIAHEMTHAMLDGVLHARGFRLRSYGASAEPEALGEALADYFAAAMSDEPTLGEWASGDAAAAYRSLSTAAACPAAIDGRPHHESLLFSGALWATRASLDPPAREGFDAAVYRAVTRAPARSDIGFADVVDALEPAALAATMRSELERRGVGCTPILPFDGALRGRLGAFYAPGTDALRSSVQTDIAPGVLQLRVELPPGTTRIKLELEAAAVEPPLHAAPRSAFAPVVLVSWGTELRWDGTRPRASAEARVGDELLVPANTLVAFLQIANRGESDGAYDYVTVTTSTEALPATAPAPSLAPARASGSGCSTGPEGTRGLSAPILLACVVAALTAGRSRGGGWRRRSSGRSSSPSSRRSRR